MRFIVLSVCLMTFLTGCGVEWFPDDSTTSSSVSVTTTSLADAPTDIAYRQTLTASGGNGTYSWVLASGSLPPGLTLSTAGTISGTPTAVSSTVAGTDVYSFTVNATDTATTPATAIRILSIFTPTNGRMYDATGKVYADGLTVVTSPSSLALTLFNLDGVEHTILVKVANYDTAGTEFPGSAFDMAVPNPFGPLTNSTVNGSSLNTYPVYNWRIKSVTVQ